jgi:transcriptional regulator GlxA family with amidase domain
MATAVCVPDRPPKSVAQAAKMTKASMHQTVNSRTRSLAHGPDLAVGAVADPATRLTDGGPLTVAFVLAPSFTLLAYAAFVDTLRLAADDGDRSRPIRCRWTVLSHDMQPIRASCGTAVLPDARFDDPRHVDYVVVVGGLLDATRPTAELDAYVCLAAHRKIRLVGICTGSFVLARLGLLQGHRCCISWFHHGQFTDRYPHIPVTADTLYIADGDRLTCAGGTSVVHLASYLVARHCGQVVASKALRIMIAQAPLPALAPQPQPPTGAETDERRVRKAMLLMDRNLDKPLSSAFIARQTGISVRQLERLFRREAGISPAAYGLRLRLQRAQELLQTGTDSVYDIALQCGFVSHSHFARQFRRAFGVPPVDWRLQHQRKRRTPTATAGDAGAQP